MQPWSSSQAHHRLPDLHHAYAASSSLYGTLISSIPADHPKQGTLPYLPQIPFSSHKTGRETGRTGGIYRFKKPCKTLQFPKLLIIQLVLYT